MSRGESSVFRGRGKKVFRGKFSEKAIYGGRDMKFGYDEDRWRRNADHSVFINRYFGRRY
jgi:hypothetical protein